MSMPHNCHLQPQESIEYWVRYTISSTYIEKKHLDKFNIKKQLIQNESSKTATNHKNVYKDQSFATSIVHERKNCY